MKRTLLNKDQKDEECDATDDAMKLYGWAHKNYDIKTKKQKTRTRRTQAKNKIK